MNFFAGVLKTFSPYLTTFLIDIITSLTLLYHECLIVHKSFWNNTKKGINSKRPTYISITKISFDKGCKLSKLPRGPIILPNPGPILPTALTAPEIPIMVLSSITATKIADTNNIAR